VCNDQAEPNDFAFAAQAPVDPDDDGYDHLADRFSYHPPQPGQARRFKRIRAGALELAKLIEDMTPGCREQIEAITRLDEAVMWANAAIARNG
jgi:hypothetical protein